MKKQAIYFLMAVALLAVFNFNGRVLAQELTEKRVSRLSASRSAVKWNVVVANAGTTLTITAPDGRVFRSEFRSGNAPEFSLLDSKREKVPDGVYVYELRLAPALSAAEKEKRRTERGRDDEPERERSARKRQPTDSLVESGSFAIVNGEAIVAGAVEPQRRSSNRTSLDGPATQNNFNRSFARLRNHLGARPDDVIPDDLIVQGSACVGLDCVSGEVFGFDTIRVKENNTRIQFDDTSTSASFPTNNWQIRANSSASGGASFLAFVDQGTTGTSEAGTISFEVDAGAPANSIKVGSNGKVGFRTATPVFDLHMNTSDTPAVRFEQNNSSGFSAQTWDIGANEANLFVRDVTGGSRLPFRVRPGAPTSSIDISASGNVGVGTASPSLELHVKATAAGLPATSGTVQTGIARLSQAAGNGVVDFGFGGGAGFGWIQAVDSTNLATNFGLLLNPNGGNVGIGTTAPTQLLWVNGTAGKPGGGTWDVFSDERLKNIKGRYNTGLKALMQLQPLRYEYKRDNALGIKLPGEQIGFGAQAVQKIIPEAVTQDSTGYLMVKSDPILWTMLNAIKEQQKEIDALKSEVRKLRASWRTRRR